MFGFRGDVGHHAGDNIDPYGSFQGGPIEDYGAGGDSLNHTTDRPNKIKAPFLLAQRRRMNIVAIVLSIFIPWLIGVFALWSMSFRVRYDYPWLAYLVLFLCILAVLVFGYFAMRAIYEKTHAGLHIPSWYIFCFLTSLFLVLSGWLFGQRLYSEFTLPAYQNGELTAYHNVDASKMRGSQMMDAGTIYFGPDTSLDLSKAMLFKDKHMYCVVPLVQGTTPPQSYDFWVVGLDCCSPPPAVGYPHGYTYQCGNWNRLDGSYVNRLMQDQDRAYYRMAVQQAEAAYSIQAIHPLFFTWPKSYSSSSSSSTGNGNGNGDGNGAGGGANGGNGQIGGNTMNASIQVATTMFNAAAFGALILQTFLVFIACIAFSTLGQP